MEQVGITFLVLSLFAFLLNEDIIAHFFGGIFLSFGLITLLISYNETANNKISEELMILIFIVTNLLVICGIYIFKHINLKDKVDNI